MLERQNLSKTNFYIILENVPSNVLIRIRDIDHDMICKHVNKLNVKAVILYSMLYRYCPCYVITSIQFQYICHALFWMFWASKKYPGKSYNNI